LYQGLLTFGAAFLGSAVESIEALTIVLAVGLTRGWRDPLYGVAAALAVLAALVLAFGQLITSRVPETTLKLAIGSLVLLFGLRWLHKAVLRSAGVLRMHDEAEEYEETVRELTRAGSRRRDWVAFTIAFKGVLLEGAEVAFIVFAVGASSHTLPLAAAGGISAMAVIAALGTVVRHPLANVPENTLKHAVGVILASLGTFWAGEGMGLAWPLDLGSILALAALFWLASRLAIRLAAGGRVAIRGAGAVG
jgi:uncharacterized membrane protein